LIAKAAHGPVDMVLDFLPQEVSAAQVLAAAPPGRTGGRQL
jgi:hypothetical protein